MRFKYLRHAVRGTYLGSSLKTSGGNELAARVVLQAKHADDEEAGGTVRSSDRKAEGLGLDDRNHQPPVTVVTGSSSSAIDGCRYAESLPPATAAAVMHATRDDADDDCCVDVEQDITAVVPSSSPYLSSSSPLRYSASIIMAPASSDEPPSVTIRSADDGRDENETAHDKSSSISLGTSTDDDELYLPSASRSSSSEEGGVDDDPLQHTFSTPWAPTNQINDATLVLGHDATSATAGTIFAKTSSRHFTSSSGSSRANNKAMINRDDDILTQCATR
eukprot:8117061-Pyramimonas_sp.AAC.1